ncbi:TSUP family transporter [Methylopila sp. Yamaguchi]|uniref:TSUP family transporter n=1 Tax=Methylopila sp. Yamaguchi TaxID=1437817 RepID=UPI000CCC3F50|nr:TSUP family transporter [Methylopila sp. Yamaguchi]
MDLPLEILALFAVVGLLAGVVDAIAGGGGLVTVPTLLLGGLDPVSAIATNKLQGAIGTAAATARFARAGMLDVRSPATWGLSIAAFLGAVAGAALVAFAPVELMRAALPFLLIAVALYFTFGPRLSDVDGRARLGPVAFALGVAAPIGAYDGLFGPGAGAFYMIGLVGLAGLGAVKAVARTKLLNLSSNLAGLIVFILAGHVVWSAGLAMSAGTLVGARLGAGLALKHGVGLVRPLVIVVALALSARLMFDPATRWAQWSDRRSDRVR